ncbi:MAG: 2OG-Fe(II) oxygenase [Nitrospirae bacterium]|nr:2OG-Fe(II) oxygenase [Nitrospirota bacterium]
MQNLTVSVEQSVQDAIDGLDLERVRRAYWDQNEFVFLERILPLEAVDQFLSEVERVRLVVNRNYVPTHKKGGSVSSYVLRRQAPAILALYESPVLHSFLSRLVQAPLLLSPADDPHACALYVYTEPGDHIGWHYDTSYYKGARYTVLVGLVERTTQCRLVAQLYKDDPVRETQELQLAMEPGSMVIFNGDKLWHAVTPLGEGEERIILTLQYVTNQAMGPFQRVFSNLKDAFAYFGPATLRRRKP